jgi:hypothetical protein
MAIKNIWSLNVDEVLVADKIKNIFSKNAWEVFFPLNAQLKDIDLILFNLKRGKARTLQIKGSRTYTPRRSERERYGDGSGAWFILSKKSIFNPDNKIDYYIFVLHSFLDGELKKKIEVNYLIMPSKKFKRMVSKKTKRKGDKYHFAIWIDPKGKRAFDLNDSKSGSRLLRPSLRSLRMASGSFTRRL